MQPDDTQDTGTPQPQTSATRTTRRRPPAAGEPKAVEPPKVPKAPSARRPRAKKSDETTVVVPVTPPAAAPVSEPAHELARLVEARDELLRSLAAADEQLAELRRAADETREGITATRGGAEDAHRAVETARAEFDSRVEEARAEFERQVVAARAELEIARNQIDTAREEAIAVRREAGGAVESFTEAGRLIAAASESAAAAKQAAAEVDESVRRAAERAEAVRAEAAAARHEFNAVARDLHRVRGEFTQLESLVSRKLEQLKAEAEVRPAPTVIETAPAAATASAAPIAPTDPAEAKQQLVRHLNDAWASEKEEADFLRKLADGTPDGTDLRGLLEEQQKLTEQQQAGVGARMLALGYEPGSGSGLIGQLSRIWDSLRKPKNESDAGIHSLLQALAAAEFEAGLYLTVHSLATAVGDADTAELAGRHLRQERSFADRLRAHIPGAAVVAESEAKE